MPLHLSFPQIYGLFFLALLILMIVLLIRAIWRSDDEGLEEAERPSLIQRIFEALRPSPP